METVVVILAMLVCVVAAALTVPAGFGLATMMTPVFLVWFDPHQAIAGVAIVHGAHNLIKSRMLREYIVDWSADWSAASIVHPVRPVVVVGGRGPDRASVVEDK